MNRTALTLGVVADLGNAPVACQLRSSTAREREFPFVPERVSKELAPLGGSATRIAGAFLLVESAQASFRVHRSPIQNRADRCLLAARGKSVIEELASNFSEQLEERLRFETLIADT